MYFNSYNNVNLYKPGGFFYKTPAQNCYDLIFVFMDVKNVKILVVEDQLSIRQNLTTALKREGFICSEAGNGEEAVSLMHQDEFDIIISDINMPKMNGIQLLEETIKMSPQTMVILMTAHATVETAVKAIRHGAVDYILKPLNYDNVILRLKYILNYKQLISENKYLRQQIDKTFNFHSIIGESSSMKDVLEMVKKVSLAKTNILISGETGTGKELIARAIHANSPRKNFSIIPVNCGAIPENLYESEFFGYKKGAFTGANQNYEGLFKAADNGTLFLDEIGDMPLNIQVKLLRAIQEKEIKPLGSNVPVNIDVRIIAATNKNLSKEVEKGNFREDLFYRLNVVEIKLPSLSQRKDDIPLLVSYFIQKYNLEIKRRIKGVDSEVMKILINHSWKGNIRELENLMERAVLLSTGEVITKNDLPRYVTGEQISPTEKYPDSLTEAVDEFEKEHLSYILNKVNGNRNEAAALLGIDTSTLYRKMQKLFNDVKT